jgi:hypothetical protein
MTAVRHLSGTPRGVSLARLYILRATYLLLVGGLGSMIWPLILTHPRTPEHMRGVTWSLLGALSLLAVLGLRYPLRMLPLLLFELAWKLIWVLAIGLPLWSAGELDAATRETWNSCLIGVVLMPLVIPWGHVWRDFAAAPGDRWRRVARQAVGRE